MSRASFDHRYYISRPGIAIGAMDNPVKKQCCDCGANFEGSRIAKRCQECRKVAKVRYQEHANGRRKRQKAKKEQ